MNEKINQRRIQLKTDLAIGRMNLLAAVAMTVLNLFLRLFAKNIALPFSIYASDFLFTLGAGSKEAGISISILPIVIGMGVIAALLLCCYFAPKDPIYMKVANTLVWLDFAFNGVMAIYLLITSGSLTLLLNFAYHVYLAVMVGKAKKAVVGLEIIPEYVDENDTYVPDNNSDEEEN